MSGLSGALLACVLGLLLLAGAGHPLARRLLPVGMSGLAATLALGFVAVGVVGGLLNLLGVANRPVVLGCVCAGVLAALAQRVWRSIAVPRLQDVAPLLPVLLMAGVYAWLVLPAGAFNQADDLYGYLPRALHMLATGSVSGGPFGSLGADGFGLQAFLQGVVLTVAPFTWAPLFDDVLALLLAGLLLDAWLRRMRAGPWWRAVSMLLLVLLPTQSINLSASHSAVAMTLLMLLAMATLRIAPGVARRESLLLGLAAGTLALLKLTFLPFAAAAMLLALAARTAGSARERLAGAGLVMLPWLGVLLLHLQPLELAAATPAFPAGVGALSSLLDAGPLHWGGTPLQFALLAGAVLLTLLVAAFARVQRRDDGATAALAMAWVSLLPAVVGAAWLADLGHAVRYVLLHLRGLGARDLDYYHWASASGAPALERIGTAVGWLVPTLVHLAERSPRLFQDGSLVLFELHSEPARESSE